MQDEIERWRRLPAAGVVQAIAREARAPLLEDTYQAAVGKLQGKFILE